MCKIGDIIVIDKYRKDGFNLSRHSFIVIEDNNGKICGFDYDMIGLVMSSFGGKDKVKKLKYPGNLEIKPSDRIIYNGGNNEEGFVKTEQFFYFNKNNIKFIKIGEVTKEVFEDIIEYIENLKVPIQQITENLS